ncbi:MAG: Gfo/Idh/MocA family oxidoreductase, partial [Verrucomicrobiales bacterium]|nr:Gfo/Idh/MocA family oxidoreductase [Verrucomicrobiales bacterium]
MITRRRLLKTSSLALFPTFAPNLGLAKSPNGKLNHACIGTDGMGWSDLQSLSSHSNIHIAAICDVDTARMAKAAEKFPQARCYQDWRELLEKEGDKIDSVNVTVP